MVLFLVNSLFLDFYSYDQQRYINFYLCKHTSSTKLVLSSEMTGSKDMHILRIFTYSVLNHSLERFFQFALPHQGLR